MKADNNILKIVNNTNNSIIELLYDYSTKNSYKNNDYPHNHMSKIVYKDKQEAIYKNIQDDDYILLNDDRVKNIFNRSADIYDYLLSKTEHQNIKEYINRLNVLIYEFFYMPEVPIYYIEILKMLISEAEEEYYNKLD